MLVEGAGFAYSTREKPFVDYFQRLRSIGMSDNEIEAKLPQLEKYYFDMVIKGVFYVNIPTLYDLFTKWKNPF